MDIELETLNLTRYNEVKYKIIKDELENGLSSSSYIHQIGERLEISKNNNKSIYNSAFVVLDNSIPVGYLFISSRINDEVFLECSILKEYRKMGYGSRITNEISDYLFEEENIRSIKLDIDPSNKKSILAANSCGFFLDEEEYESRNYMGKMQFVRESDCYINKRKKR